MPIDVQDFPVRCSLADLGIAERGLSVLQAIASKNVWCGHYPFAPGAGLFLDTVSEHRSATARDPLRRNANLHHVVQMLMIWIVFIQAQPRHELRLRLALG